MTAKDTITFGKHKGKTIEVLLRSFRPYCDWLCDQEWFPNQHPELYALLSGKPLDDVKVAASQKKELERDSLEDEIMSTAPEEFKPWWERQYGSGLRAAKSDFYIPYLRVALEAWVASFETGPKTEQTKPSFTPLSKPASGEETDVPF